MTDDAPTAVVTGATSGIGTPIALGLARRGYRLVLIARNPARAEATRAAIMRQAPGAAIEIVQADLSSLAQTVEAAEAIAATHPRIELLVNNAGLFSPSRKVTSEGHELVLTVNHLSPFLLTRTLEASLRAAAPARVVNIGSQSSDAGRIVWDDMELTRGYTFINSYRQSKLALLMQTFLWAKRLEGSGVVVNVVHPGRVSTPIGSVRHVLGVLWTIGRPFMLTPEQGADTPLHVALAPELATVTGTYFKKRKPAAPNPIALSADNLDRLWRETERLVSRPG